MNKVSKKQKLKQQQQAKELEGSLAWVLIGFIIFITIALIIFKS